MNLTLDPTHTPHSETDIIGRKSELLDSFLELSDSNSACQGIGEVEMVHKKNMLADN